MQGTAPTQRPTGVTILAVLAIIGGVLGILFGLLAVLGGGLVAASLDAGAGTLIIIFAIISIVIGVLYLAFGIGAWGLKPWAWMLGVIGAGLSLLSSIAQMILTQDIGGNILGIIIAGVILFYLFTPPVKAAFGRA
jgi:hypothetical protein